MPTLTAIYLAWRILKGICYLMGNRIDFETLGAYVKACNGKLLDALILIYIEDEGMRYANDTFFPIDTFDFNHYLHVSNAQIKSAFDRISSRFGIERELRYCRNENLNRYFYKFDRHSVDALLEIYWND